MKRLIIELKVKSPLCIKNKVKGSLIETLDYIPGSLMRGEMAKAVAGSTKLKDNEFNEIFFNDSVKFSNLYIFPSSIEEELKINKSSLKFISPIPLSCFSCKYEKGFEDEKHGVVSLLMPEKKQNNCRYCGAKLEAYSGYYRDEQGYPIHKKIFEKIAINPKLEKASDGYIYGIETINEGQVFGGYIDYQEEFENSVSHLKGISNLETFIGTGKGRGFGQVIINVLPFETYPEKVLFEDGDYFMVDLRSDAIIYDKYMMPANKIEIEDMLEYIPFEAEEIKELEKFMLTNKYIRQIPVSGWNSIKGLPKSEEWALQKGSCFLYKLKEEEKEVNKDKLKTALQKIQDYGIGERINEGYGAVLINTEIHGKPITAKVAGGEEA